MATESASGHSTAACRICGHSSPEIVHDFGLQPVAGYLERDLEAALSAPLFPNALALCHGCGLVQQAFRNAESFLVERVYSDYQPTYSMSATVRDYMRTFLDHALAGMAKDSTGYVFEIGSNDGAVLAEIKRRGYRAIGLDPSADVDTAAAAGYEVVREYFGTASAQRIREQHGAADVVLSRHTLEHVFDPIDFVGGVGAILSDRGIGVIEVPHLHQQMVNNQFQSMTFQHICFFSVTTIKRLVEAAGLALIDVLFSPMDAGAMVIFVGRKGNAARRSVADVVAFEEAAGLDAVAGLARYFDGLKIQREMTRSYLLQTHGLVGAFGAGSKGQAMLNMLSLDRDLVPLVIDETPGAVGKFVPGVGTEVVALSDARLHTLKLLLITAPSHVPEILARVQARLHPTLPVLATTPSIHFVAPTFATS